MGIVLEAWKITKTVDVKFVNGWIKFEDKAQLSDLEKETKEYDEIAFKYLYMAAVPLLLAYAVYSLLYETHKSWYSFVITTLVGSVYAYGFLMMVPSLYINYRLKSVAHMPRKAMMYKVSRQPSDPWGGLLMGCIVFEYIHRRPIRFHY